MKYLYLNGGACNMDTMKTYFQSKNRALCSPEVQAENTVKAIWRELNEAYADTNIILKYAYIEFSTGKLFYSFDDEQERIEREGVTFEITNMVKDMLIDQGWELYLPIGIGLCLI